MALTKISGDFIQDGSITQGHLHASHGITTSDIGEGSNLYFTTARVDSRIGDLSTSDLSEGTNLYYTDARADARITLQVGSNLDLSSKSTSDLSEGTNLYYTQARFNTAFTAKSTSDLSEGTNLYYTDARADARITAADTDSLSEGSTNLYYTDARADARVALIVDSAPGTLDTLNELAAALGDDANFSTTVTNSIATKLPLAGGTITSGTNIGLTINHDTFEKGLVIHRNHATNAASIVFKNNTGIIGTLLAISSDNQPYWQEGAGTDSYKIWTYNNDGSGSGLDADKLDGQQGTYYLDYGNFTSTPTIPTDFVSKANGGQFEGVITIKEDTNSTGTAGKSFLTLHNVNSDISQQQSFIDFKFTDTNANYTPQVRIGAQVGPDADANSIDKEGAGSFVVYTAPIGNNNAGGSTGLAEQFRVSYSGTVTAQGQIIATGGNSTQWNTAYTYSQVGHLPLTGGTITGDLTVNDDFQAADTKLKLVNYSGGTGITSQGELMIRSAGKTGWVYGDELGKISFYQTDGSGNGPGYQASIRATNETGNGSTTTISSCGLHFYTSNYNALERYAGRIDHDMIWDSKGGFAVDGTRKDVNWDAAYTYSQVGHMALSGDQSISGTKTFSNGSLVISGSHATISFLDTSSSADDFYIHVNSNNFYVLTDRDGGNEVDAGYESPHPLQLEADTNTAYTFGNRILTTADEGSGNGIDADTLDGVQGALFLRSDSDDTFTGRLVVANTGVRRAGMYGIYDSTKTGHIWSMDGAYMIPQNGADFGNLYGLAYYHPNNNTNGQMASGHQMVWCANGNPQSAIGTNIWTDGIIDADGATFGGTVSMNGQAISMGNGSITGINHLVINDPGVNEGLQWTGGNNWYIQECPDAMTNASGNLQFSTGTTRRFTINTSGYVYAERYYDISSTGYYLDPGDTSNLNAATFAGDLQVNGNQVRTLGANADVKFSVWSGTTYGIGMTSGVTLGHLNDYAMTFCMNNDTDRGFWWGYSGQSKAAGAMALTTNGMLTVTNRVVAPNYYVDGYIYHNGDTNTYIRMVAADDMQLVAGGRQMIRMDEGGDPDKLRFVTDSDWTNSSGNWAMSGYITVQGAVYSNDGIIYDKDDSSAYYRATGTSKPHGDIYFDTTRRIWWNSQTTSDSYFAIQGGTSSGAYIDFNATGSTKKIHWRQFSTHTRFTMDMASAAFVAMGPVSANGSDLRLKENIITIDSALAKVKAMRGVYYNRKDLDTGRRRIGVIAQEIETVIPEVVDKVGKLAQHPEYDDDEIRAVSYGNISAVLIEAIKEQQTIIDDLKSRLETLENQ